MPCLLVRCSVAMAMSGFSTLSRSAESYKFSVRLTWRGSVIDTRCDPGHDVSALSRYPGSIHRGTGSLGSGKLIEFSTASVNYTALGRIHIGTSTRQAEGVAHKRATSGCLNAIYVLNPRAKITFTLMIEGGHSTPGEVNTASHVVGGHVEAIVLDGGSGAIDCA